MNPPPLPSQPPPLPSPEPRANFGRGWLLLWTGGSVLFAVAIVAFFGFRIWQFSQHLKDHPRTKRAGREELHQATLLIMTNQRGNAHGNSSEARALAEQLSQQMKFIRNTMFKGGDARSIDMQMITEGNFLVFCQLNRGSCAFVIHVPEMRRYKSSAKESLVKLAYLAAAKTLDSARTRVTCKLAVATRGDLLFDHILIGDYHFEDQEPLDRAEEADHQGILASSLEPFFSAQQNDRLEQPTP